MILVVTGLPRSGTSLMMQMLRAGGVRIFMGEKERYDIDNPKGYLEWNNPNTNRIDPSDILRASGQAIKVLSPHLHQLPEVTQYLYIVMRRTLREVLASQSDMIHHRKGIHRDPRDPAMLQATEEHLAKVDEFLKWRKFLTVEHFHLVTNPRAEVLRLASWLDQNRFSSIGTLNQKKMRDCVDLSLYRHRIEWMKAKEKEASGK
jgi:hypothetical protein